MNYVVSLTSRAERESLIRDSLEAPIGHEDFYEFRNTKSRLPKIRIHQNVLVYRMANFRTFTKQSEYVTQHEVSGDFFEHGQEVESAQQVQHNLLSDLARTGKGELVKPIIDVLERSGQQEPLLISHSGVVVNGNRRLAAMRDLYKRDPQGNKNFNHIDCMVLPEDARSEDILDVEANLQGKPETRLDYDWIGDAQLLAALVSRHGDDKIAADRMNRGIREVQNCIRALTEAELYLKDWCHAEGEFSRIVNDGEQFFKDLAQSLAGKDVDLQDASRAIAWTLFENRERLDGRLYQFNPAFGKLAEDVLERVADKLELDEVIDDEDDEPFPIEIDGENETGYDQVVEILRGGDRKDEAVDALLDATQTAIELEKGQKSGEAALKAIRQAHSKLSGVDLSRADSDTYEGIHNQLTSIKDRAASLLEELANYQVDQDS